MDNPMKMDDLGVPLFLETPMLILKHVQLMFFFLITIFLVDEDDEGKSEIFIVLLL